jgi:hypothetical protein
MPPDNLIPPEIPDKNKDELLSSQKPFDPIEQKLEGCIALMNREYKIKFLKDMPADIKDLLSQTLVGKCEDERDEILDDISDIIQNSDNVDIDIKNILMNYI